MSSFAVVAFFALVGCGEVVVTAPGVPAVAVAAPIPNGTLFKGQKVGAGNPYWIILNGQKHDSELRTVRALGFDAATAREMGPMVDAIPTGREMHTDFQINRLIPQDLSHLQDRTVIRAAGNPFTYVICLGQRHKIDEPTLVALGLDMRRMLMLPPEQMEKIPEGPAW